MRELAVFYCPKCGYYAYYQTSRHPQCPRCSHPDVMHMARMHYREFMDMGCKERDDYLALEILKDNPSYIKRITAPHKRFNSREIIAEMNIEIMRLDTENKILLRIQRSPPKLIPRNTSGIDLFIPDHSPDHISYWYSPSRLPGLSVIILSIPAFSHFFKE